MSYRHSMKRGESSRAVISHDLRIDDPGRTNVLEDDNAVRTDESRGRMNVQYGDTFGGPSHGSILGGYRNKNTVINKRSTVINKGTVINKQYSKSECILRFCGIAPCSIGSAHLIIRRVRV
jgi:hypothetical protein